MNDEWIAIATCHGKIESQIVVGRLELEGIVTKTDSDSLGDIYPGTILDRPITIYVKNSDLTKAKEVLQD